MLPVLTLALVNVAIWSRFERAAMIEVLRSEFVHAARARGLSERRVLIAHALRNALAPLVTLVALDLGALFSGAVITETVFSWPGMGSLLRDAALTRDINVAMGIVMIGAVAVILANLAADLLYAALDPRVELRDGAAVSTPAAPGGASCATGRGWRAWSCSSSSSWRAGSGRSSRPTASPSRTWARSPGPCYAPPVRHGAARGGRPDPGARRRPGLAG